MRMINTWVIGCMWASSLVCGVPVGRSAEPDQVDYFAMIVGWQEGRPRDPETQGGRRPGHEHRTGPSSPSIAWACP